MNRTIIAALALALVLPFAGAGARANGEDAPQSMAGLELVFAEDFESGKADRWQPTDPAAWRVEKHLGTFVFHQFAQSKYTPPVRSPINIAWIRDLNVSDFIMQLQMRSTREYNPRMDLCLFFGRQEPTHFYYAHMSVVPDPNHHSIFLVNGQPRVSIADFRSSGVLWGEVFHTVRVERFVEDGLIEVFWDDEEKPILRAHDKTLTWGGIGIGSFDDTGMFDNVMVWGKKVEKP